MSILKPSVISAWAQFGGGHGGRCPTFYPMWHTVKKVIFF